LDKGDGRKEGQMRSLIATCRAHSKTHTELQEEAECGCHGTGAQKHHYIRMVQLRHEVNLFDEAAHNAALIVHIGSQRLYSHRGTQPRGEPHLSAR
jgi:hypothetical protein